MKLRRKGPVKVEVNSIQGGHYTFEFDLIDWTPKDACCCDLCPYEPNCQEFADPRDLGSASAFSDFCAAKDTELRDGSWTPIPVAGTIEAWLDEIQKKGINN